MRRFAYGAAPLFAGLVLVACQPTQSTAEAGATEAPAVERESKEVMLEAFDASLAAAQATTGEGKPVLWTLADEDTTVHMFGTVHLLRPGMDWRSEAFETAFSASDTIVFEVDLKSPEGQQALMNDFVSRGFYQDGQTLTATLNEADEAVISAALDSVGLPIAAVNSFEPWMTAVNLSVMKLQSDGYDPESGVETVLTAEAEAAGMSFGYLETARDQADAFDLLDEQAQIDFLYETALLLEESPRMLDLLVDEWADGDVAGLSSLVAEPDMTGGQEIYDNLLTKRNAKWVPQIEAMLEEPGTTFIAVGAAHLVGPDSVIQMLRDKGYEVTGP